jgi:hypothetical protein
MLLYSEIFQTCSEEHAAFMPLITGGSFPGGKVIEGVKLTAHPYLMARLRIIS